MKIQISKVEEKLHKVKDFDSFSLYRVVDDNEQPDRLESVVEQDG